MYSIKIDIKHAIMASIQTVVKSVTPITLISRRQLPKSWMKAAGLLRHKKKLLERHVQSIRREWNRGAFSV